MKFGVPDAFGGVVMDWTRVEGNWQQFQGKIKERWAKLTDDDLALVNGDRQRLEGKLQERYGISADQVRRELEEWSRTQKGSREAATAALEGFQKFGTEQFEAVAAAATSFTKGWQELAAETTEFSRKAIEANTDFLDKLLGAKTLDRAIQIQTEFAKSRYEDFIAETSKIGQLYARFAREAFRPIETAYEGRKLLRASGSA